MPQRRRTKGLAGLADRLIARHLRVSLPDVGVRRALQGEMAPEESLEQRIRCVAVVGAGASASLVKRGAELAEELEGRFRVQDDARRAELLRLQRVYGLDPEDFETRLAALSRSPEITEEIREAIAGRYAYRHPTILGYELLAHLMKHRFLDAIVNFNFDELLDQSLDDELGEAGYTRIVSNRDAIGVVGDPDAADYLPLHIKLHGTATEPESLRLTREAYYELPEKLVDVVEGIFASNRTVIVNVGSAMTGFDLHRLLRIPEQLEIYDLSPVGLSLPVQEAIARERSEPLADSFREEEKREPPFFALPGAGLRVPKAGGSCDEWLKRLVAEIDRRSGARADARGLARLVDFRSVDRHEALADVLGPDVTLSRWIQDPERFHDDYVDYLRHRTIVELAFSGAKSRGLAQLSWLALDRCGKYYELYRRQSRKGATENWGTLRLAGGLDANDSLPEVLESKPDLCGPTAGPTRDAEGRWALREFVPGSLAAHVVGHIGSGTGDHRKRRLEIALKRLQAGSEVEIDSTDDRVCAKAFESAVTLPTLTALAIFTARLFQGLDPEDEVYISCETGEWLLGESPITEALKRQEKVEVLTAFDLKSPQLRRRYDGRLRIKTIDPWRHNRHMTIVCKGSYPLRAVYFARRLRAPAITPVYLGEAEDAGRVKRAFELMRDEVEPRRPA